MRRKRRLGVWACVVCAGLGMVSALAELLHCRAHRHLSGVGTAGSEIVLVLGYSADDRGRIHPVQRWRTEIAVRSMAADRPSRLIFTGAAKKAGRSEAEVMAAYARDVLGVPEDRIQLEIKAESTWQNIEYTLPELERAATIKVASDPMHAGRARDYLVRQRPELVDRLAAADDYRLGEKLWLKLPTAAYEILRRVR